MRFLTEEQKQFRIMKKFFGITNEDIAQITGNTPQSINTATQPSKKLPRNYKLALWVFEQMKPTDFDMYDE